jgi:deoxyadenosine/deoxycytidine kinase
MRIVFDGNIGCGKSSIIKKIKELNLINSLFFNEPLNDWNEWMTLFYSDMSKYSFGFQLRVLKSHIDKKNIINGIFERSPLSCQRIFGDLLFEDNLMTKLEWNLIEEFYTDYGWTPNVVIYLKCDPEICHKRILQRNRDCENIISLEYLQRIHNKYEQLYKNNDSIKVIEIDANQTIDKVFDEIMIYYFNEIK